MKTPSHLPAEYFVELTGVPRRTFYNRIVAGNIDYIQQFRGVRLYSVRDWNRKNPDLQMPSEINV